MKILFINGDTSGSTGSIINALRQEASNVGFETFLAAGKDSGKCANYLIRGNSLYEFANKVLCRFNGSDGFHNAHSTKKLIKYISSIKPDLIHLHTIHGHFVNIEILLNYCRDNKIKIVWTLHDCWTFTGKCCHFENLECQKWKTQCQNCPDLKAYPFAFLKDSTKTLYKRKKKMFNMNNDIVFVTPSLWLNKMFHKSMLCSYSCEIINNGIKRRETVKNDWVSKNDGPIIFFSAAYPFTKEKGINVITRLADELDESKYKFVVAGLTPEEAAKASKKISCVGIIKDKYTMDKFYSSSDYFLNPTYQDTFPTVNIEALMNGTPVITFNSGGSAEVLSSDSGVVLDRGDYNSLKSFIINNAKHKTEFVSQKCKQRSLFFTEEQMCKKYIALYERALNERLGNE